MSFIYTLCFLVALLCALYVSANFWPLLFLFLWIAIPFWLILIWRRHNKKK